MREKAQVMPARNLALFGLRDETAIGFGVEPHPNFVKVKVLSGQRLCLKR
jgi:hypothetical protein